MTAGKAITYSYDARGQRDHMIDPDGGRFTYSFDAAGRLEHLVNPEGDRTTYTYDADDRETLKQLANGAVASATYDAAGRLDLLENLTSTGTMISSYQYAYDSAGNPTSVVDADSVAVTWAYDSTDQLVNEHRSGGASGGGVGWETFTLSQWEEFTLDEWEEFTLEGGASSAYHTTFTYDPVGNRLRNRGTQYRY